MPSSPVSLTFHPATTTTRTRFTLLCPSFFERAETSRVSIQLRVQRHRRRVETTRVTPHGYRVVYSIKRMEARSSDSRSTGGNDKIEIKKKKKFLFQRGTPYREINTDQIHDDYGNKIET